MGGKGRFSMAVNHGSPDTGPTQTRTQTNPDPHPDQTGRTRTNPDPDPDQPGDQKGRFMSGGRFTKEARSARGWFTGLGRGAGLARVPVLNQGPVYRKKGLV